MNNHKIKTGTEEAYDRSINESKKYLESISALDLMLKSQEFHKQIVSLIDSLHLPASIVIGILTAEAHRLSSDLVEFKYLAAFELFKQYVDENYMKKE